MAKQFTSASANKYLKGLQEEKDFILESEAKTCTYVLAAGEEEEPPSYSYEETRERIDEIDAHMLKIRHQLHSFNIRATLPESKITIDEALVKMAQLNVKKHRLASLRSRRAKERVSGGYFSREPTTPEYTYANYDIAKADTDYREVCEEISNLQLEIDLLNQTKTFEVEL